VFLRDTFAEEYHHLGKGKEINWLLGFSRQGPASHTAKSVQTNAGRPKSGTVD
jgi:hypothetical protein